MSTTTAPGRRRRISLHPTPPPPSPNILHSPLRSRMRHKQSESTATHHSRTSNTKTTTSLLHKQYLSRKTGKLENQFDQDVVSNSELFQRRESVKEDEDKDNSGRIMFHGEKWKFQAEILRDECNFQRMDMNRVMTTERTLRSAVEMLVSGREKTVEEKSNVNMILDEEIDDLAMKLEQLQSNSRVEMRQKACGLHHRLEKTGRELTESNLGVNVKHNVDKSSSMLDAGVKNKRTDQFSESTTIQLHQGQMWHDEHKSMVRCKAIVRKIMQQVRAETEQWSQMQEMLGQVRDEMDELQTSRDYWESRALNTDCEIQSLKETVEQWRDKSSSYENKASELQLELSVAKEELQRLKEEVHSRRCRDMTLLLELPVAPSGGKLMRTKSDDRSRMTPTKNSPAITLAKQLAKEKWMRKRHLKENCHATKDCGKQEVGARRVKIYAKSKGIESMTRSLILNIE